MTRTEVPARVVVVSDALDGAGCRIAHNAGKVRLSKRCCAPSADAAGPTRAGWSRAAHVAIDVAFRKRYTPAAVCGSAGRGPAR
jgi:hypothetical protein